MIFNVILIPTLMTKFHSTNMREKSNLTSVQFYMALGETQVCNTYIIYMDDICVILLKKYEGLNITEFSVIWLKITTVLTFISVHYIEVLV